MDWKTRQLLKNIHKNCRNSLYPSTNVNRFNVSDNNTPWSVDYPEYEPPEYTSPDIHGKPWADPDISDPNFKPKWHELDGSVNRRSYRGDYQINSDGRPQNPAGRTGLRGRGLLGRWGPNHAADPIVTRWKPETEAEEKSRRANWELKVLQFIGIQRKDTKQWAIPGGMVDGDELITSTLKREFMEEALNSLEKTPTQLARMRNAINKLFKIGEPLYRSYVDDPRNTDNSWMETTAVNFHDNDGDILGDITLEAGDDASAVRWIDISEDLNLYADHIEFVKLAARLRNAHW